MRIHQSFCLPCFAASADQWDQVLRIAAEIGYAGAEIWGRDQNFDHLVELTCKHKLTIASMCGHASLAVGLNQACEHDRIEQEIKESIDLAQKHHIPGVICFSGNRVPGQTEQDAVENCVRGFKRVAGYAEQQGVNLNMELLNSKVDHPGYNNDHTA